MKRLKKEVNEYRKALSADMMRLRLELEEEFDECGNRGCGHEDDEPWSYRIVRRGVYTEKKKKVLMCAVSRKQVALLKEAVYGIDPGAFMILMDSHEIRGEGFLDYSHDEL